MAGSKYRYATVGVNEERDDPVAVLGKEGATFEVGSETFDRTALLMLPERMTESQFNQWKSEEDISLIDIYFHCIHQIPRSEELLPEEDDPEDERPDDEAQAVTDGGQRGRLRIGINPLVDDMTAILTIGGEEDSDDS